MVINIKRVTDYIKINDVREFNKGDIITIDAGTGAGKSHWVKNIVYLVAKEQNKKILVFTNRNRLKEQWKNDIKGKEDTITVMNYQSLENRILKGDGFDFSEYDYIISDEYHYFFTDSKFNHLTDISLNTILNKTNKIRIFMSATADLCNKYIKNYRKLEVKEYIIPRNEITNNVNTLMFYNNDETVMNMFKEAIATKPNEKIIYFCQSATKAYEVHKQFEKDSIFCCSSNSDKFYKHVNQEEITNILKDNKFEKQILITTTCMDCGVNLVDESLKHIIADVEDIDTLIQCLGRKRSQTIEDVICVYIKNINNNKLGGRITQNKKKIEMAEYLRSNNASAFVQQYPRQLDYSKIIYDIPSSDDWNLVEKKVNEIMLFKYRCDNIDFDGIAKKGKNGYRLHMKELLCQDVYFDLDETRENEMLEEYLDSIIGKRLYAKEDKNVLQEKVGLKNPKNSRLIKDCATISAYLTSEYKSKYTLINDTDWERKIDDNSDCKNSYYGKVYWLIK